jgi:hypothetical protein
MGLLTRDLLELELELEFVLRPTVSRPVSLGIGPPFGTLDQILSCSSFVWQWCRSAFNACSLTRKRVCNLLLNCFWSLPEQSYLSRSPTELTAISYCLLWDSPNLEGQVPVFITPRNRVAKLYPRALGSLSVASYDSQGLRWKYSNPPPHGEILFFNTLFPLYWVSASCCACNNEWVQQSFVLNNVSACFIKHVYHNMFRLKSKPSSCVIVYRILNASYH